MILTTGVTRKTAFQNLKAIYKFSCFPSLRASLLNSASTRIIFFTLLKFMYLTLSSSRFRMRVDLLRQKSSLSNFGIRQKDFVQWHQKKRTFYRFDLTLQTGKNKNRSCLSLFKFSGDGTQKCFYVALETSLRKQNKRNKTLTYHHSLL